MLGRKFFVTVLAIFLMLLVSLPAYAATSSLLFVSDLDNTSFIDNGFFGANNITASTNLLGNAGYDTSLVTTKLPSGAIYIPSGSGNTISLTLGDLTWNETYDDPEFYFDDVVNLNLIGVDFAGGDDPVNWQYFCQTYSSTNFTTFAISATDGSYAEGTFDFTAVPVPGAGWLLGSGLVGLMGLRRRNRKS